MADCVNWTELESYTAIYPVRYGVCRPRRWLLFIRLSSSASTPIAIDSRVASSI